MSNQTGIWIDLNKAVVINLNNSSSSSETIYSEIETKKREEGEGGVNGRFGKQYLSDEKTKDHKLHQEVQRFLKRIHPKLKETGELVLFGPAHMKLELQKSIQKNAGLSKKIENIEVHSADSMTDNQTIAWVKNFFNKK